VNSRSPRLLSGLTGAILFVTPLSADVLHLAQGGRLEGVVTRETETSITIDVGVGAVSVPRNRVLKIERKESALSEYRSRLASIGKGDVAALVELARFAASHGLRSEAKTVWARVASLDPGNVEAHLALGHVLSGGRYVDEAEAYRAQGFVYFDGRWMSPLEQESLLRSREEEARDRRRADEARRVAREAEDRARRAEAEAGRARAEAERQAPSLPWGYGSAIVVTSPHWGGYTAGCRRAECGTVPPIWTAPTPAPAPTPHPRARPRPRSLH
jgi:hypothetical protein